MNRKEDGGRLLGKWRRSRSRRRGRAAVAELAGANVPIEVLDSAACACQVGKRLVLFLVLLFLSCFNNAITLNLQLVQYSA